MLVAADVASGTEPQAEVGNRPQRSGRLRGGAGLPSDHAHLEVLASFPPDSASHPAFESQHEKILVFMLRGSRRIIKKNDYATYDTREKHFFPKQLPQIPDKLI